MVEPWIPRTKLSVVGWGVSGVDVTTRCEVSAFPLPTQPPSPRKKCALRGPGFHGEAEGLKALDQAVGELGFVTAIEVVGAEITVVDVVLSM